MQWKILVIGMVHTQPKEGLRQEKAATLFLCKKIQKDVYCTKKPLKRVAIT